MAVNSISAVLLCLLAVICANMNQDWWRTSVIYQVYPRSFKDTDGDGVGDLKGIEEKLDYLMDIGVNGVWLSPIFRSPMADFGYDIANFTDIDPIFGTMDDFDDLIKKADTLG
uniref:Glycosyl hydrolase family 13 catalytic domain-containing protein n=1 Tax=Timema cristinae TaxID=61476 RepID=A0A7R9CM46_TIMCR|nr:unnamed protein product [Timema cristinae]